MVTPALAALWWLPFVSVICVWVAWSDMATMKIPNRAVLALLAVFLVVGPFVLPLSDWLWRWAHLGVVLVIGILANAVRIVGAGDAKFAAAAAPFVAVGDLLVVLVILSAAAILGYLGHRLAKNTGLRRLVPHWQSWSSGKRFPMGLPLAITLVAYLALAAFPPVV